MATMGTEAVLVLLLFAILTPESFVSAGPNLIVSHSPEYVHFKKDAGKIATSQVDKLISSVFGHSLTKDLKWSGLEQGSLFHRPKANVLITLEGVQDVNINHIAKFPVDADEVVVNTPHVANRLENRPQGEKSFIVDFSENNVYDIQAKHPKQLGRLPGSLRDIRDHILGDNSAFIGLNLGALNSSQDQDAVFLGELQVMHEVLRALQKEQAIVKDSVPDLYHFRVGGMNQLVSHYGANSQPVFDAHRLLNTFIDKVTASFRELYGGHVIIEILTLPEVDSSAHVRKTRSLLADVPDPTPKLTIRQLLGVSDTYDKEFAAIFNIILWTMIFLALIVTAVSYGMWTMDPGRDSIIYRMTSQRIKKD